MYTSPEFRKFSPVPVILWCHSYFSNNPIFSLKGVGSLIPTIGES